MSEPVPEPVPAHRRVVTLLHRHRWTIGVGFGFAALLGTWVIGLPRYGAPDEVAHTIKAYGTAHGETTGDAIPGISPLTRSFMSPIDLASEGHACFAFQPDVPASCAAPVGDGTLVRLPTSAATYPPAYYALTGGLARLTGTEHSLRVYRMFSVAMVSVLLALGAARLAKLGRGRPRLLVLALTPMAVFMSSAVNPTAIEIAGTLLLWTYLTWLAAAPEPAGRRQLLGASTIAASVVLVRPVALPWVAVAIVSFFVLERRPLADDRRSWFRLMAWSSVPLAAACIASAAWSRYAGVGLTDDKFIDSSSTIDVFRAGLGRTSLLVEQAIGVLGWLDTDMPFLVIVLSVCCLVGAIGLVLLHGDRRVRLLMTSFIAIWVLYPTLYVTLAKTPLVWQGRYNLPLLGGIVMCVAWVARDRIDATLLRPCLRFLAVSFVVVEVLAFHQTLRRFMVGARGDILLRDPPWHPGVNAWVLIVVNAAAACGLMSMLRRSPVAGAR